MVENTRKNITNASSPSCRVYLMDDTGELKPEDIKYEPFNHEHKPTTTQNLAIKAPSESKHRGLVAIGAHKHRHDETIKI